MGTAAQRSLTRWALWCPIHLAALLLFWLSLLPGVAVAQVTPPEGMTDIYLLSRLRPIYTLAPGEQVEAELVLENRGEQAATVRLYQRDYRTNEEGDSLYEIPGTAARSNASWISLSRSEVRLGPGERLIVPYRVEVPALDSLTGSYWSVIMVEPQNADAIDYQDIGGGARAGVRTVFRYAVTVVTNLPGGPSQLGFEAPQLLYQADSGRYALSLRITNLGQRLLEPDVWLELYSSKGEQVGRFDGKRKRVFPGGVATQRFDLGTLEAGTYQAVIIADAGGEEIFAVRYTMNLRSDTP